MGKEKIAFETLCSAADIYAKLPGVSRTDSEIWLFKTVESISIEVGEFKPNGWAVKFYDHFLYGNGKDVGFNLAVLLMEDQGVRRGCSESFCKSLV